MLVSECRRGMRSLLLLSATEDRLHGTDDSGVLGYIRDTQVHSDTLGYTRIYSNTLGYTQVRSDTFVNTRTIWPRSG